MDSSNSCALQRWLGPLSRAHFEQTVFRRVAWARPQAAIEEAQSFSWRELGQLLAHRPEPDVLVVARSESLRVPEPRSLTSLEALMARGIGICVRHAERHHGAVAAAASRLAACFERSVHVQVFVTPAQTHGFGWHYDAEDVFIIQTSGMKDYYFRANTVCQPSPARDPDFSAVRRERSPLQTARLLPGDCLYLPAGFWHMARSVEASLSLSLGVYAGQRAAIACTSCTGAAT